MENVSDIDSVIKKLSDAHNRADKELDRAYAASKHGGSMSDWDNALERTKKIEVMIKSLREIRSFMLHCID